MRLSLEAAQQMAIERNRTLENASIDVKIAQANRWQAIASMLPQVNASGTYNDMFGYNERGEVVFSRRGAERVGAGFKGLEELTMVEGISTTMTRNRIPSRLWAADGNGRMCSALHDGQQVCGCHCQGFRTCCYRCLCP